MRLITYIFILILLIRQTTQKSIRKTIKLSNFNKQGPFIFFTKFHIGGGYGQMDMTYNKGDQIISQQFYNDISIGMVNQTVYQQFISSKQCHKKINLLYKKQKFNFRQERQGMKHVKIFDLEKQQIWYFYIYSCLTSLDQLKHSNQEIIINLSVLNNGDHFGQNQQILYAYICLVIIWIILMIKFAYPLGNILTFKTPDALKLCIFGSLIILGAGYLYKLIHLILYNFDGSGIYFFQILYLVLKNIGQAVMTTVIIAISWGWSIKHLNSGQTYIIIGVLAGLINIVSLILAFLTEQHEQLYHHYDTIPGIIVLILRIILFLVFLSGIISCLKQISGPILFIKKFALVGGLYLICWPITVLLVQLLLPNYMHRQIIIFIEELVHIFMCNLMCSMISQPQSAYRRVSLHEDDNPLRINNYHK